MAEGDAIPPMPNKPRLQVIDGERAKFERRIFNLVISPDWAKHEAEFNRLLTILKRRGNLSLVQVGQDGSFDNGKIEGDKD